MTTPAPLEKRHWIKNHEGIGCFIPREMKAYDQVILAFNRDLVTARQLSGKGKPNADYFARKAQVIEEALASFTIKEKENKDGKYEVGYDLGHKFIYPGLPVEFAEAIDAAIVEVIELISQCRHVALTGSCCAGHPSKILLNPYLHSSLNDPEFLEKTKGRHNSEEFIYSENLSPHLALVLFRDGIGKCIASMLAEIRAIAMPEGDVDNLEIVSSLREIRGPDPSRFLTIVLDGHPTIYLNGKAVEYRNSHDNRIIGHDEFVPLYQEALCAYWRNVKNIFESAMIKWVPSPEAHQFTPKSSLEWDRDYKNHVSKVRAGHKLPHYLYFNGNGDGTLLDPEMLL